MLGGGGVWYRAGVGGEWIWGGGVGLVLTLREALWDLDLHHTGWCVDLDHLAAVDAIRHGHSHHLHRGLGLSNGLRDWLTGIHLSRSASRPEFLRKIKVDY